MPCDDPDWSNFTKLFALRFRDFGIKKLISTSYAPDSNQGGLFYTPPAGLFHDPRYDAEKELSCGKLYTLEEDNFTQDERIDADNLSWEYLEGDGDFNSDEVTALRDEADIIITNPPFSLFRDFVAWLMAGDVQFSIIGNMNAITYKEIFPLLKDNKMWLGTTQPKEFRVPEETPSNDNQEWKDHLRFQKFGNINWFTNIQHGLRHDPLKLLSMEDNLIYNSRITKNKNSYRKYDNYNAIEVPSVSGIPSDYKGIMGVPITFLHKYCPEQFTILGSHRWAKSDEVLDAYTGNVVPPEDDKKTTIDGKETYSRIFITHLK